MIHNPELLGFLERIADLVPEYCANPLDLSVNGGTAAYVVIDASGGVHGRVFGSDQATMKRTYEIAWRKASQVWLTKTATVEFERKIFTGVLNEGDYAISPPDYIGWEGGIPLSLGGEELAAAFSGFRGSSDAEILRRAAGKN